MIRESRRFSLWMVVAFICSCRGGGQAGFTPSDLELEAELASEPAYVRRRFNTSLEEKKRYAEQLARSRLLFEEARRQKIDQQPALLRRYRQMVVDTLIQRLRKKISAQSISDEEVRRYYKEHRAEYERPAMVRAAQIVVGSRKQAEELRAELQAVEGSVERLQRFQSAAASKSLDARTRYRGGDLGFLHKGSTGVQPGLLTAALALETMGELAPVVEIGPASFAVLMRTGARAEGSGHSSRCSLAPGCAWSTSGGAGWWRSCCTGCRAADQ